MSEKTTDRAKTAPRKRAAGPGKTAATAAPETAPKAAPEPRAAEPSPITPEQRAQIETLSMNLARAAMTAQGAIAEMALKSADRPAAL
ncbi:MAG: hypothetical protein JWP50_817, partial [Phenylobacterium sp.]|nr:hypothetical protein [Phenylobacterium sp.]